MEVTEQAMPPLSLWLLTAPGRARILAGTLRSFAQSDCPPPRVFTDPGGPPVPPLQRLVRAFHAMLTAAVAATTTPWLLCCEDDIAVSHHLLHNLSAWPPLRTGSLCTFCDDIPWVTLIAGVPPAAKQIRRPPAISSPRSNPAAKARAPARSKAPAHTEDKKTRSENLSTTILAVAALLYAVGASLGDNERKAVADVGPASYLRTAKVG